MTWNGARAGRLRFKSVAGKDNLSAAFGPPGRFAQEKAKAAPGGRGLYGQAR